MSQNKKIEIYQDELEDWYQELSEVSNQNIPREARERILDLRDEIYRYLR